MKRIIKIIITFVVVIFVVLASIYIYRTHKNVKAVMAYENQISQTLKEQGLQGDTKLALGIIYTETKGKVPDVMQSSESLTATKGSISTESESINQGVANLTKVLEYAQVKHTDVWTGVQAYNYGQSYVDYVAQHGGTNNIDLARAYSRDVVAPSLGNKTGETYYHITLDSLMNNGGKLYVNGGNMFYASEVKWHMFLLDVFNW
ncbi:MAG: lysozyme family protein [Streptococcaceae bacterium]|nr:lysozyme family protein [Streptococcaceae bacterium]MCL2681602.1 lysozyme family protein [Streptococcaceae bacterium]